MVKKNIKINVFFMCVFTVRHKTQNTLHEGTRLW